MTRQAFEAWISSPPYEHMCDRRSEESAWPGQYKRYETELAWEAWQAAMLSATLAEREECAKLCELWDASPATRLAQAIRARSGT